MIVPLLACVLSSLGTELHACTRRETISPPKKLGLDLELLAKDGAVPATPEGSQGDKLVWSSKVQELANRGITVRQLLDFYSDLGVEVMSHFDPDRSTTHDVVRQAIIPQSIRIKERRSFVVVVHRATGLAALDLISSSDPYCVVSIGSGQESRARLKPWKGGGRTSVITDSQSPVWEKAFLVEDLIGSLVLCATCQAMQHRGFAVCRAVHERYPERTCMGKQEAEQEKKKNKDKKKKKKKKKERNKKKRKSERGQLGQSLKHRSERWKQWLAHVALVFAELLSKHAFRVCEKTVPSSMPQKKKKGRANVTEI